VYAPEATEALGWVLASAAKAGASPVVHCCADDVPIGLIAAAGADALLVDASLIDSRHYDDLAVAIDGGLDLWPGVVPTSEPAVRPGAEQLAESVHRLWSAVGHSLNEGHKAMAARTVVTPACGLAGAGPSWARTALTLARDTARQLSVEG
jgi:hypothetical protein